MFERMYYQPMTRGPLLHADADAFFASVALLARPDLIGRPVAVVAHVFVASATYAARAYGVRGGMLIHEALALCPELVVLDVPHAQIEEVSDSLFALFHEFSDRVEPGSIEEGFLDMSDQDWPSAIANARRLRERCAAELGITITVGVGRTKLMAKLASRAGKPNGLYVIDKERELDLRSTLPIADIWGIGSLTAKRLATLDVITLVDLDRVSGKELQQLCGTTIAQRLRGIRAGTDDAVVRSVRHRASFASEGSTAGYNRPDSSPLQILESCIRRVCHRAEKAGLAGTRLTVNLRVVTQQSARPLWCTVAEPTASLEVWLPLAAVLIDDEHLPALTGLGVCLEGLVPADQIQVALF